MRPEDNPHLLDTTTIEPLKQAMKYANVAFSIGDAKSSGFPLVYVNPAFEALTGYSAAEVLGKSCTFLQGPDNDLSAVQQIRAGLHEGVPVSVVIRNFRKDGSLFWNQLHLSPLLNTEGVITHFLGIQIDVTPIKIMEEEFRQSRQMLQLVMDNIPMTIFWKDTQSVFLGCNRQLLIDAGVATVDEVIGKTDYDFPWRDQAAGYQAVDKEVMETGISRVNFEEEIVRHDGAVRILLTTKVPLRDMHGKVIGILGMHADITDRKRAEADLMEAERLRLELESEREMIALKQKFVSTVSHEFRTPLTAIVTSTEILDRFKERISPEKRDEHLAIIRAQSSYMRNLLDDLLVYSQGMQGRIRFAPQPVNVALFCRTLIEQMQAVDKENHHWIVEVGKFASNILLDDSLLRHIFVNLLTNARKYSPAGSEIALRVIQDGEMLMFTVQDHGMGIPLDDQANLFEPFHRAQNAQNIKGTGLGLAIVKDSVEAHGGSIHCESREGEGTTFTVCLPLKH